jgi:tetratricopeptide (TPR) repeat protein
MAMGQLEEATEHAQEALALTEHLEDSKSLWATMEARSLLAETLQQEPVKQMQAREAELRQAREIGMPLEFLAVLTNNLGIDYGRQGRTDEGRALLEESLEIAERIWGDRHHETATRRHHLARLLITSNPQGAQQQVQRAAAALDPGDPGFGLLMTRLAFVEVELAKHSKSETELRKAKQKLRECSAEVWDDPDFTEEEREHVHELLSE